jgi:hypothetical protein
MKLILTYLLKSTVPQPSRSCPATIPQPSRNRPGAVPLGSVLSRRELKLKFKVEDNENIFNLSGFIVAKGQPLSPTWDIAKKGILKGTIFQKALPDYRSRFVRVSDYLSR